MLNRTRCHAFACSLLIPLLAALSAGCGGDETPQAPAPPPSAEAAPSLSLEARPAGPVAPVPAPGVPAAAPDTGMAGSPAPAGNNPTLEQRIAAGEEGTTPDPAGDPNVDALQTASDSFYNEFDRAPSSLQELVQRGHIRAIPRAPKGMKYAIDSNTGEVSSVSAN